MYAKCNNINQSEIFGFMRDVLSKSSLKYHYLFLGILSFLVFLAFRATMPFIADEDLMFSSLVADNISLLSQRAIIEFRPLSMFFEIEMAHFFNKSEVGAFIFSVLLIGAMVSTISMIVFNLTLKITNNICAAYGAAFINLFSAIFLTGSFLYLYTVSYIIPHFFNFLAFFFYFRYVSSDGSNTKKNLLFISFCCFVGPLFREAGLIAPLTIVLCELFRHVSCFLKKNITQQPSLRDGFLFLALFLHSIAPKGIFYLLGIYGGSFSTIFGGEKLISTNASFSLNLNRFLQISLEFPPSLWVVVLFGLSGLIYRYITLLRGGFLLPSFDRVADVSLSRRFRVIIPIFLIILAVFLRSFLSEDASVLLYITILLTSFLTINPYLTLLAIVSLIPAIFIQSNHLIADIFFITPFSIIFSIGVYFAYDSLKYVADKKVKIVAQICFIVIFIISIGDFLANYFSSHISMMNINKKHQEVAMWMSDNIPGDATVVTNFFAGRDILVKYDRYSNLGRESNFFLYDQVNRGLSYPEYKGRKEEMLKKARTNILKEKEGVDVYFLLIKSYNADYPLYLPHDKMEMIQSEVVDNFVMHIDPLRYLIFNKEFLAKFNHKITLLPESRVFPQYDTSYNNYHTDSCCIMSSKIGLYKLPHKFLISLDEDDFKYERFDKFGNAILEN